MLISANRVQARVLSRIILVLWGLITVLMVEVRVLMIIMLSLNRYQLC